MAARIRSITRFCARVARVATLALVVAVLVLVFAVRAAIADVKASMLELGQHVSAFAEQRPGPARTVVLNGQSIELDVTTTRQSVGTVLDFYEAWCQRRDGRFADQALLLDDLDESPSVDSSWLDLTMRADGDGEGFVACLAGGGELTSRELVARVERYGETGNLADLGRFHYVYATRTDDGTRVVTVWTDGDFYLERMFPASGDAPGADVPGIPRPPTGRRMLSAHEIGFEETLTVYIEGSDDVATLLAHYRKSFARNGWTVLGDRPTGFNQHVFLVERGDELRAVGVGLDDEGQSFVSIAAAADRRDDQ